MQNILERLKKTTAASSGDLPPLSDAFGPIDILALTSLITNSILYHNECSFRFKNYFYFFYDNPAIAKSLQQHQ